MFIRRADFLLKHNFVQTVKDKVLILGFQGTVPQNQRLYRADSQVKVLLLPFSFFSVLLIEVFCHLFLSRSRGFVERQRLAGRWATQSRSRLRLLTLKEIS